MVKNCYFSAVFFAKPLGLIRSPGHPDSIPCPIAD